MTCCCPHSASAGRLFGSLARRYRRRFEKRGLEKSQRQLFEGLQRIGFSGARILEVGCGVGHFHQSMLEAGAGIAIGIDLSQRMIDEARRWAADRGLESRCRYVVADFVDLNPVERTDMTVLDKVICCYPDARQLVDRTVLATARCIGFTLPVNRWYTRLGTRIGAIFLWMTGSCFRPYVHDPEAIDRQLIEAGFVARFEASTSIWLTRVYLRDNAPGLPQETA